MALLLGILAGVVVLVFMFPGLLLSRKKVEDTKWIIRVFYVFSVAAVAGLLAAALPFLLARLIGGPVAVVFGAVGAVLFFVTLGSVAERLLKKHKMIRGGDRDRG